MSEDIRRIISGKMRDLKDLRCSYRASTCTRTAVDALVSVNNTLTISLGDSSYWTCVHASAAADALITNLISHFHRPPCINSTSIISNTILI